MSQLRSFDYCSCTCCYNFHRQGTDRASVDSAGTRNRCYHRRSYVRGTTSVSKDFKMGSQYLPVPSRLERFQKLQDARSRTDVYPRLPEPTWLHLYSVAGFSRRTLKFTAVSYNFFLHSIIYLSSILSEVLTHFLQRSNYRRPSTDR